jgi:hypothetical protein
MAERIACSAIFLCLSTALAHSSALGDASTASRPSLPRPTSLIHIHEALAELDPLELASALARGRASADDCTLGDGFVRCTELSWEVDGHHVSAATWEYRRDQRAQWTYLNFETTDGERLFAETWESADDESVATNVSWDAPGRPQLGASAAVIETPSEGGLEIRLTRLIWRRPWGDGRVGPLLTAERATFDGRWRVVATRAESPIGPALGDIETEHPLPESGFLPPSIVHAGDEATEFEAIALQAAPGLNTALAGYLRGTGGRWYGLGLGVVGRHVAGPRGHRLADDRSIATVGAVWKPAARPAVAAEGDAILGTPLQHGALALETPGYVEAWSTQSIRRGAYFRDWSHSRAGIGLHGYSHVLRASLFGSRTYTGLDAGRSGGGRLGFGTEQQVGEFTRAGLEIEQVTVTLSGEDNHLSSIRSDVMAEFGRPDKAYVRVGGLGRVRARLVPTEVGFGAGTSGGVFATAEAGLSFTGRFEHLEHGVRPSVFATSEVVDFEKSAAEAISDGSDTPIGTAVAAAESRPWHTAGLRVGQTFSGTELTIDLPLEVFAATFGRPSSFTDILGASGGLTLMYPFGGDDEFTASGHLVCERACQNVAWDVGSRLLLGRWTLGVDIARQNRLAQRIADLQATRDAWARILAFELPPSTLRVTQSAHVGWSARRFRLDVNGVTDFDEWGVSVEPHVAFEELGWSVGLTGFYDDFNGDWGVLAGLRGR